MRIYLITDRVSGTQHLVRARNQAQAIRLVAGAQFGAAVAGQETLVSLIQDGVVVRDATEMEASE